MNVVHLDIVINTAYEKFSMKVYDIICESNLNEANPFSWLGLLKGGAKAVPRKFISAADKRAFEEASDELADIIGAKMKSGGLDHAPNIKDAEKYIDSGLLAAKKSEGAGGEAWIQDMIYTAVKKAHERSTASAAAATAKTGNTGGSLFFTGVKTAINTLLAYGIFSNVDEVFNNPKNGYMTMMREHERHFKFDGEQTPERLAQFQNAHRETLKVAVGRLAWTVPTVAIGGVLAIFKVLIMLKSGTLALIGLKKVAAGLTALGQFASYGAKSVLAGYLAWLNSDTIIMNADINRDGKIEPLRPLDAIKWLIVDDAFYVSTVVLGPATDAIAAPLEQALILAYEDLIEKYGVDINTGLSKVGAKPLPSAVPGSKKSLGTRTAPAPAVTNTTTTPNADTAPDEKFNPADWKQTKSGFYQHNKTPFELISRQDYQKKSQSQ